MFYNLRSLWLYCIDCSLKKNSHLNKKLVRLLSENESKELEYYLMTISVCQVKCFGWWTCTKSVCELQHWQSAHPWVPRELKPTHTLTHTYTKTLGALSVRSGDGSRGVRPSVKARSSRRTHLRSPRSSEASGAQRYQKSRLEKHNSAVNTSDKVTRNGRKYRWKEDKFSLSVKDHLHRKLQRSLGH